MQATCRLAALKLCAVRSLPSRTRLIEIYNKVVDSYSAILLAASNRASCLHRVGNCGFDFPTSTSLRIDGPCIPPCCFRPTLRACCTGASEAAGRRSRHTRVLSIPPLSRMTTETLVPWVMCLGCFFVALGGELSTDRWPYPGF